MEGAQDAPHDFGNLDALADSEVLPARRARADCQYPYGYSGQLQTPRTHMISKLPPGMLADEEPSELEIMHARRT